MTPIRVILVDDHAILREGVRALLSYEAGIQVIAEAENGEEAIARVGELRPDVVLMDLHMVSMNGLDATCEICKAYPGARVLILSQYDYPEYVVSMLRAGAAGYILKRALGKELVTAIHTVYRGEIYLHPGVSSVLVDLMRNRKDLGAGADTLTQREREILGLIVDGKTNPQIASRLSLSVKTVDWHRTNLMNKLNAHNAADLVRYALQHGLAAREP